MADKTVVFIKEEPRGPSQVIEIQVTRDGANRILFPDQSQLRSLVNRNIILKGINLITLDALTNGPITGQPTSPLTELQKATLVLYSDDWEKALYIPLLMLNSLAGGASPFRYNKTVFDDWKNIAWEKCYIQYANTTFSAGSPYVFLLEVEYQRINADGTVAVGA